MATPAALQKSLNPDAPEFIPSSSSTSLCKSNKSLLPICRPLPPRSQYPPPPYYFHHSPLPLLPFPHLHYYSPSRLPLPPPPSFCTTMSSSASYYQNPTYVPNCVMGLENQWQANPPLLSTVHSPPHITDHQQVKHGAGEAPFQKVKSRLASAAGKKRKDLFFKGRRIHFDRSGGGIWMRKSPVKASMDGGGEFTEKQAVMPPMSGGGEITEKQAAMSPMNGGGEIKQDSPKTTLMIKNIPNKYTRRMLMRFLDEHCNVQNERAKSEASPEDMDKGSESAFDFLYLPIDFKRYLNKGYAFVNFTNPTGAWKLYLYLNNYKWGVLKSSKICQITYAKFQGKDALLEHFKGTSFQCDSDEFLPVYFDPARDGAADQEVKQFLVGRRWGRASTSKKARSRS